MSHAQDIDADHKAAQSLYGKYFLGWIMTFWASHEVKIDYRAPNQLIEVRFADYSLADRCASRGKSVLWVFCLCVYRIIRMLLSKPISDFNVSVSSSDLVFFSTLTGISSVGSNSLQLPSHFSFRCTHNILPTCF